MSDRFVVTADRTRCMGSGICGAVAPEIFALRDQRVSVLVEEPDDPAIALEASQICPALAITVRERE
ncbi:ferredoxin [Streptomyces sp. NPDC051014]|uniref:ferredoxin n=1 Tax=Streptomyces sp. NPDC051014 TaxID=3155751 RepID=UPI0033C3890E